MKKTMNMSFLMKLFCGFLFASAIPAVSISLLIHVLVTRLYKNELGNLYMERLRMADTVLNAWEEETKKNALIISLNCGRLLEDHIRGTEKYPPGEPKTSYDIINNLMAVSKVLEDVVVVNNLYSSITLIYENYEYLINSNYVVKKNDNLETTKKYTAYIAEGKHWVVENPGEQGLVYVFPVISASIIQPKGIIIFNISEKELSGIINGSADGKAAKIFIMDDKGTVISDADKANLGKNLMSIHPIKPIYDSPDKKGFFTSKIEGAEYFVIYRISELNNWYYCSLVPMTELNRRMNIISLMTAALMLAFFILAAILSYLLAKRLNIPVKKMEYQLEDYKLIQFLLGKSDNKIDVPKPLVPEQTSLEKYFVHPYFCCVLLRADYPDRSEKNPGNEYYHGGGGGSLSCALTYCPKKFSAGGLFWKTTTSRWC